MACVADTPNPRATLLLPVAMVLSPKAEPPLAAEALKPTGIDPVATAPVPMAMELVPMLWLLNPMAIGEWRVPSLNGNAVGGRAPPRMGRWRNGDYDSANYTRAYR